MQDQSKNAALLVMDMQNGIVSHYAEDVVFPPVQKALAHAREHHIPVIFIRVGFSEGYPEVSPQNKVFSSIAKIGGMTTSDESTQIHAAVKPEANEPIVTKYRFSAFAGSTLETILRSRQIDTLILCGIATSGVVLSTVREAFDKDFSLTVLKDACFDQDPEVHRVLTEKVFPKQANVVTVDAWCDILV
ncbi:cysteine hydrolase [Caldibacillus lycopersici]|uniref:Cysteine hydrolase n=1 Tax=Perspicuibacillus lycopersici TaxID=1325689 RepID=A0AAE3LQF4_9BACI|nr:isochorismatase family cysteine hydrolase [Perspicuibacillus lycopersici]MCU9613434.1 cysteine hydrolase [Perspicuibacillus lycopersici]